MLRLAGWSLALALAWALLGCGKAAVEPSENPAPPVDSAEQGEGVVWRWDYDEATAEGKQLGRVLMINVTAPWCKACQYMEETVYSRSDVAQAVGDLVLVKVNGEEREDVMREFAVRGYPTVIFLSPEGEAIGRVRGVVPAAIMLEEMAKAAAQAATPGE